MVKICVKIFLAGIYTSITKRFYKIRARKIFSSSLHRASEAPELAFTIPDFALGIILLVIRVPSGIERDAMVANEISFKIKGSSIMRGF